MRDVVALSLGRHGPSEEVRTAATVDGIVAWMGLE